MSREEPQKRSGLWATFRTKRSPVFRSAIGLALLIPAVWAGFDFFILTGTSEALVVAPTTILRAPIAGAVRLSNLKTGDWLRDGQVVAVVDNPRTDDSRLAELEGRIRALDGDLDATQQTVGKLENLLLALQQRGHKYSRMRTKQLSALVAEARKELDASQAVAEDALRKLERRRAMSSEGVVSDELLAEAERDQTVASARVQATQNRIDSLLLERDSMQGGVSLDGYSDKPYSMQRVDEIELNLVRLRAAFANQTRTKEALQREFLAEQARLARLSHASIEVPRDSRLKQVLAGQGTFVNVGDNIMEVVECSKLAVVAELTEREYARVRIGTRVHFSPRGYDEVFEGVVSQKLGPEGRYIEPALSVFRVVLALPRLSLRLGTNCEIGLSGDAYFDV